MNFRQALDRTCPTCGAKASQHRMTERGVLYCLRLNSAGRAYQRQLERLDEPWFDTMLYTMTVKRLTRSAFGPEVGAAILKGLRETEVAT